MGVPSNSVGSFCAQVVLQSLAVIAVLVRFVVRRETRQPLKSDDWTILASLFVSLGIFAGYIYSVCAGTVGVPWASLSEATYMKYRQIFFSDILLCHFAYGLIKISVVLFYKRIFLINRRFRIAANTVLVAISIFIILSFFLMLFDARGVSSFWTTPPTLEGTEYVPGLYPPTLITAFACLDVVLDVCVLSMPIPIVFRLNLSMQRRVGIALIFLLGAFCLVCSVVRLYYTRALVDFNTYTIQQKQNATELNDLWAHMEASASILTACLPTLRPLIAKGSDVKSLIGKVRSMFSILSSSADLHSGRWARSEEPHNKPAGQGSWYEMNTSSVVEATPWKRGNVAETQSQNSEAIMVQKSFELQPV
ncbi:hypothetical protein GGR56DRAFT_630884 [Xylariaceae sp. FL0804]|nr:hypothetical protein GGR56DRAFT_630884 [Xylariaceae sp. FL0804]